MTVKVTFPRSVLLAGSVGRQTIGSLGSSEDSSGSLKKPTLSERHPKVVRSLTVVAYIFSVSLAAILLSFYYMVLWSPKITSPDKSQNNSTISPCLRGPYTDRGIEYLPSKYRYSNHHVPHSPPSNTPPPLFAIPIPDLVGQNIPNNSSLSEHDTGDSSQGPRDEQQQIKQPPETVPTITTTPKSSVIQHTKRRRGKTIGR